MTTFKATDLLYLITEYKRGLFSPGFVESIAAFLAEGEETILTKSALAEADPATVRTVDHLTGLTDMSEAAKFLRLVPTEIQLNILLRLQKFESVLRKVGEKSISVPVEFSAILKWGLIDLWKTR